MKVEAVPLFSDNYSYIIVDTKSMMAAIVDAAQPAKVAPSAPCDAVVCL
jgi:hypothetical protein